ncbi:MAG TPA: hypothetical protein V6D17_16780 [Candidatus Obscuribacterales bacterium]
MTENTSNPTISPKLADFIRTTVREVLNAARCTDVREVRVRFTDPDSQYNNFEWFYASTLAPSNDFQGPKPERFWMHTWMDIEFPAPDVYEVRPTESLNLDELTDIACAFFNRRFARATRLEIRLECEPTDYKRSSLAHSPDPDVARANRIFLPHVGNSDEGFDKVRPWESPTADLPA